MGLLYGISFADKQPDEINCLKIYLYSLLSKKYSNDVIEDETDALNQSELFVQYREIFSNIDISSFEPFIIDEISCYTLSEFLMKETPWLVCNAEQLVMILRNLISEEPEENVAFLIRFFEVLKRIPETDRTEERYLELQKSYGCLTDRYDLYLQMEKNAIFYTFDKWNRYSDEIKMKATIRNWQMELNRFAEEYDVELNSEREAKLHRFLFQRTPTVNRNAFYAILTDAVIPKTELLHTESHDMKREIIKPINFLKYRDDSAMQNAPLYCGMVLPMFGARAKMVKDGVVLIVGASVAFIDEWMKSTNWSSVATTFVMENDGVKIELLRIQAEQNRKTNISFMEYDNLLELKETEEKIPIALTLFFHSDWKGPGKYDMLALIGAISKGEEHEFICVSGTTDFQSSEEFSDALTDETVHVDSIALLPQNLIRSAYPRRKLLVLGKLNCKHVRSSKPIDLVYYRLQAEAGIQSLTRYPKFAVPLHIEYCELENGLTDTVRMIYETELRKSNRDSTNEHGIRLDITPELTLSYTYISRTRGSTKQLQVYFLDVPKPSTRNDRLIRSLIKETKKLITVKDDDDISEKLFNNYLFAKVNINGNPTYLSTVVGERYKDYLNEKKGNMSFRTFVYINYPVLLNQIENMDGLIELAFSSVGTLEINRMRASYEERIREEFGRDCRLYEKIDLIVTALNLAVKQGYIRKNLVRAANVNKQDAAISEVRNALIKKNFILDELLQIYRWTIEKIDCGYCEYISVLIRLFTGLSCDNVAELRWKDIVAQDQYGFSQFRVERTVGKNLDDIIGLKSEREYRLIPIIPSLMEKLMKVKSSRVASDEDLIVLRNGEAMPPRRIRAISNDAIRSLNVESRYIDVPDSKGGTKRINLTDYIGDYFSMNYDFWLGIKAGMNQDEIAYLQGTTPTMTFSRHYCDWRSDEVQLVLYRKMLRINSLFMDCDIYLQTIQCGDEFRIRVTAGPNGTRNSVILLTEGKNAKAVIHTEGGVIVTKFVTGKESEI